MKIDEVFFDDQQGTDRTLYRAIYQRVDRFLAESQGIPLLKNLPKAYGHFHKVKVRQKKPTQFAETFNTGFEDVARLHQRAIFANGPSSFEQSSDPNQQPYYIFPINGYKSMYSAEMRHSNVQYKQVFDALFEQFGNDKEQAIGVISDLLKYTYTKDNLHEGIKGGAEIIIYGIPYYYAIQQADFVKYEDLLEVMEWQP